jgi:alkylresorcinol/alkylpyrone synthase
MTDALPVRLLSTATAVPPHRLAQADVAGAARDLYAGRVGGWEHLAAVFPSTGVDFRHSTVPLDWFGQPRGWVEKNRLYHDTANALLTEVGTAALDRAGVAAADVGAVVCVSSTGIATPTLEAGLIDRLGLPRMVQRLPLFGRGCVGGTVGLARAAMMARALPGRPVLFLVVELCTLAFRHGALDKASVVASALFGDGAAATVLVAGEGGGGATATHWGEYTWPDSRDVMGWTVEDDGLGVIFAKRIPTLVRDCLRPAADEVLAAMELTGDSLRGLVAHPGGPKVLDGVAASFPELANTLQEAREVLREYGNMSAASVLFVLEKVQAAGRSGRQLMLSFGPGFTTGLVVLEL